MLMTLDRPAHIFVSLIFHPCIWFLGYQVLIGIAYVVSLTGTE